MSDDGTEPATKRVRVDQDQLQQQGDAQQQQAPLTEVPASAPAADAAATQQQDAAASFEAHDSSTQQHGAAPSGEEVVPTELKIAPGAYTQREEYLIKQEEEGEISFCYVENDGTPQNMIHLTGLKNIFSKQLPNMPKVGHRHGSRWGRVQRPMHLVPHHRHRC